MIREQINQEQMIRAQISQIPEMEAILEAADIPAAEETAIPDKVQNRQFQLDIPEQCRQYTDTSFLQVWWKERGEKKVEHHTGTYWISSVISVLEAGDLYICLRHLQMVRQCRMDGSGLMEMEEWQQAGWQMRQEIHFIWIQNKIP